MKILLTIFLLGFYSCAFGQFGNLIRKATKPKVSTKTKRTAKNQKTTTATSSAGSSKSTTTKTTTEKEEGRERREDGSPKNDGSPIYRAYSRLIDHFSYAEEASEKFAKRNDIKNSEGRIVTYFEKIQKELDFLNGETTETDQLYLTNFNKKFAELQQKYEADKIKNQELVKHEKNIKKYKMWIFYDKEMEPSLEASYKGYYKHRDAFLTAYPAYSTQENIKALDAFFKVEVYEKVAEMDEDVSKLIKENHEVHNGREYYILNVEGCVSRLTTKLEKLAEYKTVFLEDHTTANALTAKIEKEKSMLDTYISSGEYAKNRGKYEQGLIDARLLVKGMSDANIESVAKSKLPEEYGKVLRVTIASTGWTINKNGLGIPENKEVLMNFATKKADGKCYYISANIGRTYEGGGKYGALYLNWPRDNGEMNCNNINKTK